METPMNETVFGLGRAGHTSVENAAELEKGWRFLFEQCLKTLAEGGKPPVWKG